MAGKLLKSFLKRVLPARVRRQLRFDLVRYSETPPYKCVRFGSLRRTTPIHSGFSIGRGTYIDRYYIEKYLQKHAACIKGRVVEFADGEYTLRFGGDRVTHSDILDVRANHAPATIVADLTAVNNIPPESFDCIVMTQVLNFIYDVRAAVHTLYRILKPGGCVLVSVSGISQIVPDEMEYCGDYWRFTRVSLRRLFEEVFPAENITIESQGNVLAAVAFLHGLAAEELKPEELDYCDPDFEVSILLKAVKDFN
jgi:SAM-dependent methyltransferase